MFACTKTFLADTLCCSDGFGLSLDDSQDEGSEDNGSGLSWTQAIEARDGTSTEKAHSTVEPLAQRDGGSIADQNGFSNMLQIAAGKKQRVSGSKKTKMDGAGDSGGGLGGGGPGGGGLALLQVTLKQLTYILYSILS